MKGASDSLPFGDEGGRSGEGEKHRYTSYERDRESGTDYAVNRQYSKVTGRFNRADSTGGSIALPQSLNRYTYSGNDSVNLVDPTGLVFCDATSRTCASTRGGGFGWYDLGDQPQNLPGFGTKWGSLSAYEERRHDLIINVGYDPESPDRDEVKGLDQETVDACWQAAFGDSDKAGNVFIGHHSSRQRLRIANLMLWGGGNDVTLSAMVGAIWAYESRGLDFRPIGDNGPMQVTSVWKAYMVPGAFDTFKRGAKDPRRFTGDVRANIEMGGAIVTYLYNRYVVHGGGRLGFIPYWYGPGKNPSRSEYEGLIMSAYPQFEKFVKCLQGK